MKKAVLLLLILNILSCKSQESNSELALKKCVNQAINNNIDSRIEKQSFDFYTFSLKVEKLLTDKGVLKNEKKDTYHELLNSILEGKKNDPHNNVYNEGVKIMDNIGFDFNLFSINNNIFNQCPYKVSNEQEDGEGKLIHSQGSILNRLMEHGFTDKELLSDLMNNIDDKNFKKIVYRAPIILLVMINLDNQYNIDLIKYKESLKTKKFLNKNGSVPN